MTSRREMLTLGLAGGAATLFGLGAERTQAQVPSAPLLTRPIPRSGQRLPVVGLGSSATFASMADAADIEALRQVFTAFVDEGGTVFDTAPSYGAAEVVAGQVVNVLGLRDRLFWATKLNVAGFGGRKADAQRAQAQMDASFKAIGKPVIDLIQIHNLGDLATQLPLLQALREQQRIRYLGVTTTMKHHREQLEQLMRTEALDFIGIDYAIDNRELEARILPLAAEQGIAVLAYAPFGRTRLWNLVKGHEVPEWAAELGIRSWGQFFLKFVISHPAITCTTPATSRAHNVVDNLAAGSGLLPDNPMRERMARHLQSL